LDSTDIVSAIPVLGSAISDIMIVFTVYYFAFKIIEAIANITKKTNKKQIKTNKNMKKMLKTKDGREFETQLDKEDADFLERYDYYIEEEEGRTNYVARDVINPRTGKVEVEYLHNDIMGRILWNRQKFGRDRI
jgi:hypothetical protein